MQRELLSFSGVEAILMGVFAEGTLLRFRVTRHDRTQIEVKLTYRLRADVAAHSYQVETFMFVPKTLGIHQKSYSSKRFYSDITHHIRMMAPVVPLSELSKKSAVKPWASDIKALVDGIAAGEQVDPDAAVKGLKLLACTFKFSVGQEHLRIRQLIGTAIDSEAWKKAGKQLQRFVDDLETALRRLHKVGDRSTRPEVPTVVQEGWAAVDEYASLLAEEALTDLVELADVGSSSGRLGSALDSARDLAIAQYEHRRAMGCKTYAVEDDTNEYLTRRWRILKRYVSSVLYLDIKRDQEGALLSDVVGMTAAAAAMLVATVCIVLITSVWAASLSVAFLSAMVVSYVIKDRIKELGKRHLGKRLRENLSDHVIRIVGGNKKTLGTVKEWFDVVAVDDVPDVVSDLRYNEVGTQVAIEGRPEVVMHHRKSVELRSGPLTEQFVGADGLTDVIRINLHPLMVRMDDPDELYRFVNPTSRRVETAPCLRVYHVNIVFRFTSADGDVRSQVRRIVLNETGIIRVEEPASTGDGHNRGADRKHRQIRIFDD